MWVAGNVASSEQQQLVLEVARRVPGVRQVVNDLKVKASNPASVQLTGGSNAAPAQMPQMAYPYPVNRNVPMAFAPARTVSHAQQGGGVMAQPAPMPAFAPVGGIAPARYDQPHLPNYAWPSYAAYPNYGAVTYPKQYSASAWPYIGPFYPYPQVPLGWRKVELQWDDGWWMLNFKDR